jgi:hypothetical protein
VTCSALARSSESEGCVAFSANGIPRYSGTTILILPDTKPPRFDADHGVCARQLRIRTAMVRHVVVMRGQDSKVALVKLTIRES